MGRLPGKIDGLCRFCPTRGADHCAPQIYLYSNQLAERGVKKMEKKNVVFTKDGAKVGVKEVTAESYTDKTQRAFVKTWNAAHDGYAYALPQRQDNPCTD